MKRDNEIAAMSGLEWEESMIELYSGDDERERFVRNSKLSEAIDSAEEYLERKGVQRNLKVCFIEALLDREEGDGFLIISLIAHLRKVFEGSSPRRSLKSLLEEWNEQGGNPTTHDTLFFVLSKRMHEKQIPFYLRHALVYQCKRVRVREGPTNRRAARRILRQAENLDLDGTGHPENMANYSLLPLKHKDLGLELQSLFCDSRFSDWGKVVDDANKLLGKIEDAEGLAGAKHRPDIQLKWWCWDVMHRAACCCCDKRLFVEANDKLEELEKESPPRLQNYFTDLKVRGHDPMADRDAKRNVFTEFFGAWAAFEGKWKEALAYRVGGGRGKKLSEEKAKLYTDFTKALQDLNEFFHYNSAKGRSKFVSHSYSTSREETRRRTEKILAEVSQARHMVVMSDTFRSAYLLEILHRLLIYRLWWESINYAPEDSASENLLFFEPAAAVRILKSIRGDMESIHTDKRSNSVWKNAIDVSISTLIDLESDRQSEADDGVSEIVREAEEEEKRPAQVVTRRLRTRLDYMQKLGDRHYRETNNDENAGICQIFGVPYRPEEESPYDFIGLRLAVGRSQMPRSDSDQPLD